MLDHQRTQVDRRLADLSDAFAAGLPARTLAMKDNLEKAKAATQTSDALKFVSSIVQEAHKLAGAGKIFGFAAVSETSSILEQSCHDLLEQGPHFKAGTGFDDIGAGINNLSSLRKPETGTRRRKTIMLIDRDPDLASSLKAQLSVLDLDLVWGESPDDLTPCLDGISPAAIIIDICFLGENDATVRMINELQATGRIDCPVVFLSQRRDIDARLGAHRAGCSAYLAKPFEVAELVNALLQSESLYNREPYRVMVVDDDTDICGHYKVMLEGVGFDVLTLSDPLQALKAASEFSPDGIILDVDMPGCTGIELAAVLRQDQDYLHVPIIFLTSNTSEIRKLSAVLAGGDEFLLKGASPDYIIATLKTRTRKSRELKRKIERLGFSENHFRSLAQRVADAIVSIDRDGRVVQWNRGAENIFGYREKEILGLPIRRLFSDFDRAEQTDCLFLPPSGDSVNGSSAAPFERTALTSDNREISVEMTVSRWEKDNHWHCTAIFRDVTERRKRQKVLQEKIAEATRELSAKSKKLEGALRKEKQVNQMQRQFVSMASHEFRTPLAIIDSTAQRLSSIVMKPGNDAMIGKKACKIRNAVERLSNLIESTLAVEILDSGTTVFNPQTCNLRILINEICERQREITTSHMLVCNVDALPDRITADRGKLDQIVTNLLSNAIKYSPDAGSIEVNGWREDNRAVISVCDFGLGIPPGELGRIYDRFFRASTSVGIVGTGIGLYLVHEFVALHNGSIDVESKEGEGSTFTIRLPVD